MNDTVPYTSVMVPRGSPRTQAIFVAALDLVAELGYDRVTVDAIAARAHASKATIYRRWPDKATLLKAALDANDREFVADMPDTGSLAGDLLAALNVARAQLDDRYLMLMSSLLSAAHRDPDLAAALRSHVVDEELSPFAPIVARAIARGELRTDADAELVHEVGEALLIRRALVGDPLDDAFLARVVERVLLVILGAAR
jgi:AcrR family transcriptional regulator